jgi:hypothetical protein
MYGELNSILFTLKFNITAILILFSGNKHQIYDHHNTFWDRARAQQNNNTHCLKQFYVSLNDEYQKSYSGTRRSLGS